MLALALVPALVGLLTGAPAAFAQTPLPPSISIDSAFSPPNGIARDDGPGFEPDAAGAVVVDGDRIYTVGESGNSVVIVARRANGALDTGFGNGGRLEIAPGPDRKEAGVDAVVLPDRRLRVLASTQRRTSNPRNVDVAIFGLNPNGTPDLSFGGGGGRTSFAVNPSFSSDDHPLALAVDGAGRLAVAGRVTSSPTTTPATENAFVALRAPDGSAAATFGGNGKRILDRGTSGRLDRATDIAWRPGGGLFAIVELDTDPRIETSYQATVRALREDGADDPSFGGDGAVALDVGESDTTAGALLVHGGRAWVTGTTRRSGDQDAYLASVEADGGGLRSRRFDMRGTAFPADRPVGSGGLGLALLRGEPDTLVVVGFTQQPNVSTSYWSAAAFNDFDGDLARAGFGDLLVATEEGGRLVDVDAGEGFLATAGTLGSSSGSVDSSFGTARLLVDAEKRCDLAIAVPRPLELEFVAGRPAPVTVRVSNAGTRACAGHVSVPPSYELRLGPETGPLATGRLAPGAAWERQALLVHRGPRRISDTVPFAVSTADDANARNDSTRVRAIFSFCDVQLSAAGSPALAPTEGARRFPLSVRNVGTAPCRRVSVRPTLGATSTEAVEPYTVAPGRSASDEVAARVRGPRRIGRRATIQFRAHADEDIGASNDAVTVRPLLIGVGDSAANRPRGRARTFTGRATAGRGPVARRTLAVRNVDIAVRRLGRRCVWLVSAAARFRTVPSRSCARPRWLRTRGTSRWRLRLRRALPPGRYVLLSRATIRAGFPEASFSARDGNRVTFVVRGRRPARAMREAGAAAAPRRAARTAAALLARSPVGPHGGA